MDAIKKIKKAFFKKMVSLATENKKNAVSFPIFQVFVLLNFLKDNSIFFQKKFSDNLE